MLAEPVDPEVGPVRIAYRKTFVAEIEARLAAAIAAHHMPQQDVALAAPAVVGALIEGLIGPLALEIPEDPAKRAMPPRFRLLALRGVGVVDALARGLVVQDAAAAAGPTGRIIPSHT